MSRSTRRTRFLPPIAGGAPTTGWEALDKWVGNVVWRSNLPGNNVHHGNWSSPAVGVLGGVPQVVGYVLGPNRPDKAKNSPYECGFEAFEDAPAVATAPEGGIEVDAFSSYRQCLHRLFEQYSHMGRTARHSTSSPRPGGKSPASASAASSFCRFQPASLQISKCDPMPTR